MIYGYQLSLDSSKENEKYHFLTGDHISEAFSFSELHRMSAYSAKTEHSLRMSGAPFRFKLSSAQIVN